jgi:hypothetical protein
MAESEVIKCLNCMDLSCDWSAWRENLRRNITGEKHFYWQDEAVQHVAENLNSLLNKKISAKTAEEELIQEMWDIASIDERKSLAMVLLKLTEKS